MQTFGRTTFFTNLLLLGIVVVILPMIHDTESALPLGIPIAMLLGQLFYSPIIRLSNERLRINTLSPLIKNMDIPVADIQRIYINIQYTVQFTIMMKDGTIQNMHTCRYALDMKPLYLALREKNIPVSSYGYDTVDWTQ